MTKHQWRTVHGGAGILVCALGLAAAGCGGGGGSDMQTQPGAQASMTLADHLTLSLSEDKTSASTGGNVTYQITLTNSTGALIVSDGSVGAVDPPTPPTMPITITIPPGQALSATEVYTFTRTGVYTATVALQRPDLTLTPAAGPLTVTVH